ncbi:MAG: serine hydrolase domain-containing protein [Planctomycetota bacterium]
MALVAIASASVASGTRANELWPQRLTEELDALKCPGAVVGLFPDEGPAATVAVGAADKESRTLVRLDMRIRIGSVSKLFVGAAALCLVDRGVLSLDDPVSRYVPGVPNSERITLPMLGDQTSGLGDPTTSSILQAKILKAPRRPWKPREVRAMADAETTATKPGRGHRYANTNTVLLGQVLTSATGKPFPKSSKEPWRGRWG